MEYVSIPQAVGTVATLHYSDDKALEAQVSIPQAVGTVATLKTYCTQFLISGFNTASGRYCCNGH